MKVRLQQALNECTSFYIRLAVSKFGIVKGFSESQAKELVKKAKEAWGDVSQWTSAHVSEAGLFLSKVLAVKF